jgi:hypothetical protein
MIVAETEPGVCAEIQRVDIGEFTGELADLEELPAIDRSNLAVYLAETCLNCVRACGEIEVSTINESEVCSTALQRAVLLAVDTDAHWEASDPLAL